MRFELCRASTGSSNSSEPGSRRPICRWVKSTSVTTSMSLHFGSIAVAVQGLVFRPFLAWSRTGKHPFNTFLEVVSQSDRYFPKDIYTIADKENKNGMQFSLVPKYF